MDGDFVRNLGAFSAQLALVTAVGGVLPTLLRMRAPDVTYTYYRALLLVGLALPLVQPWPPALAPAAPIALPPASLPFVPSTIPVIDQPAAAPAVTPAHIGIILVVGIVCRLLWIGLGLVRLRRLRRAGAVVSVPAGCDDLHRAIGADAELRWVDDLRQPVTFGVRRPVVLLPASLRDCAIEQQRAVIAHELLHVRRRDWAWVLGEEALRALLWFHPAVWWLISRIQLAREALVDQLVVLATNKRRAYLEALLSFADRPPLAPGPATAFARRRHLLHRMALISQEVVMSSQRVLVSFAVMATVILATGWYAVSAFPLTVPTAAATRVGAELDLVGPSLVRPSQNPPAQIVTAAAGQVKADRADITDTIRQLRSRLGQAPAARRRISHVGAIYPAAAAVIKASGWVTLAATIDKTGTVMETQLVNVSLSPVRSSLQGTMAQSRGVADALVDAAATAVQQWKYEPGPEPTTVQVSFRFYPDRAAAEDFLPPPPPSPPRPWPTFATPELVLGGVVGSVPGGVVGGVVGGVGGGVEQTVGGPPYRIGGTMKPPLKLVDLRPVYPSDAREARVQGVVIIETVIDEAGNVSDARILRSIPMLDQAALDAVRQWKFVPTLLNGAAVPVIMTVTVNFTLDGAEARAVHAQDHHRAHRAHREQ